MALHQQVYAPKCGDYRQQWWADILYVTDAYGRAGAERFYCMPHALNFKHTAAMFGLDYVAPNCWDDLFTTVTACWRGKPKQH